MAHRTLHRAAALLLATLALSACTGVLLRSDFERDRVSLVSHVLPVQNVRNVCADLSGDLKLEARGCARFSARVETCEIFVPEPRDQDDAATFATIGHEVWHCPRGRFHDARDER